MSLRPSNLMDRLANLAAIVALTVLVMAVLLQVIARYALCLSSILDRRIGALCHDLGRIIGDNSVI